MKLSRTLLKNRRTLPVALFVLLISNAPHAPTCRAQSSTTAPVITQAPPQTQSQPAASHGSGEGDAYQAQAPTTQAQTEGDARNGKPSRPVLGSIKGRIIGDAGESLPGIVVFAVRRAFDPTSFSYDAHAQHSATADDDGNFSIGGLEPGLYGLVASMPGYVSEPDPLTGRPTGVYRPGDTATVRLVKGGVVTGAVTDVQGQPLVSVSVRAYRLRDLDGRMTNAPFNFTSEGRTDDRGVYRIYGLLPGIYVVLAFYGLASPYGDLPTFYPSSTRDTALEVTVRSGQDTAGVDIRYRDDQQGHRVTGRIVPTAAQPGDAAVGISLTYASSGIQAGNAYVMPNSTDNSFSLDAVPDGDYDLQASSSNRNGLASTSAPQRISVRGADVTGLRLTLAPLANASGTLVIEPLSDANRASDACKNRRSSLLPQETLISAVADRPAKGSPLSHISGLRDSAPDSSGAFTLRNLEPGRYRLAVRPADEALYVRTVELPGASTPAAPLSTSTAATRTTAASHSTTTTAQAQRASTNATRDLFDIRAGQQLSGIRLRLAEGAAAFSGHIAAAENSTLPPLASLRVYLVPAEREHADDTLRFYEVMPAPDGSFSFKNLAPGHYLVVARAISETPDASPRSVFRDADSRARLRRDAEAANTTVELETCVRVSDFTLRLTAPAK